MTDSGAFQQFSRALYLSNKKIVDFQRKIGADAIANSERAPCVPFPFSLREKVNRASIVADLGRCFGRLKD